jgi:carboxypeptidase PM20D1
MKKILRILLGLFLVLILVVIIKTITFRSMQIDVEPVTLPAIGMESVANLSRAITFPTISHDVDLPIDTLAFQGFHQFLSEAYPLIHSDLKKEVFSEFSLLYTWEGKNPDQKPIILMAHMDVVPAPDEERWEQPPYSGANDGTFIWGRGAIDDKGRLIATLEALEKLIREDFAPDRTIYLAIGHDEEISGLRGASVIANALAERGVEAEFVLDEGLSITTGIIPMVSKPVASIGLSEKGYMSVALTVEMEGGHSSYPEKETSVTVLNQVLYKLNNKPMKAFISEPVKEFIRYTGPEMPILPRVIFANLWLFEGVVINIYTGSKAGNAAVRTVNSPTILTAGVKDNVIPTKAEAVVNFRMLPGETSKDVMQHLQKVIADERVKISAYGDIQEPSSVSSINSPGFEILHTTIKQVFPEVMLNPMLAIGQTDSRHYINVSNNIYRFVPITFLEEDLARMHGLNERISIENYHRAIGFYYQLIKNLD